MLARGGVGPDNINGELSAMPIALVMMSSCESGMVPWIAQFSFSEVSLVRLVGGVEVAIVVGVAANESEGVTV